ncbi:MAG: hypothetical protein Q8R08_00240, partial [bacterium]|nr:hypothetical protein [bacterium]
YEEIMQDRVGATEDLGEKAKPAESVPAAEARGKIEFIGERRILEAVAKNNLTKFREWLVAAYKTNEGALQAGLGESMYALLSGNVDEYLRLLKDNVPFSGDHTIRNQVIEKNVPYLKAWILKNYKIADAELQKAFGQAYVDMGFDIVSEQSLREAMEKIKE